MKKTFAGVFTENAEVLRTLAWTGRSGAKKIQCCVFGIFLIVRMVSELSVRDVRYAARRMLHY